MFVLVSYLLVFTLLFEISLWNPWDFFDKYINSKVFQGLNSKESNDFERHSDLYALKCVQCTNMSLWKDICALDVA